MLSNNAHYTHLKLYRIEPVYTQSTAFYKPRKSRLKYIFVIYWTPIILASPVRYIRQTAIQTHSEIIIVSSAPFPYYKHFAKRTSTLSLSLSVCTINMGHGNGIIILYYFLHTLYRTQTILHTMTVIFSYLPWHIYKPKQLGCLIELVNVKQWSVYKLWINRIFLLYSFFCLFLDIIKFKVQLEFCSFYTMPRKLF